MEDPPPPYSYDQGNDPPGYTPGPGNQVAPVHVPPRTDTFPMQTQPQRQHMTIIAIHPAWVGRYPFTSSRVFNDDGGINWGVNKWIPEPDEGPYRPFAIEQTRNGATATGFVEAKDNKELDEEIKSTKNQLSCYTFFCCFLFALQGLKHIKKSREYYTIGSDIEARNALLDAKISQTKSFFSGVRVCYGICLGALIIALLPFIWIPYVVIMFT